MRAHVHALDTQTMGTSGGSEHYEIRVRGLLSETVLHAFPTLHADARGTETVLVGAIPDQAALHGVLGQIEALGLVLLEVRRRRP
jgi:monoterpene epsilon-lactone hydrolase